MARQRYNYSPISVKSAVDNAKRQGLLTEEQAQEQLDKHQGTIAANSVLATRFQSVKGNRPPSSVRRQNW